MYVSISQVARPESLSSSSSPDSSVASLSAGWSPKRATCYYRASQGITSVMWGGRGGGNLTYVRF